MIDARPRLAPDTPGEAPRPAPWRDDGYGSPASLRTKVKQGLLSILVLAVAVGLPVGGFFYSLAQHDHEHDSVHDGVAREAMMPRVPTVIGDSAVVGDNEWVLRTPPAPDEQASGGADPREL